MNEKSKARNKATLLAVYLPILIERIEGWENGSYDNTSIDYRRAVLEAIDYWVRVLDCPHVINDKLLVTMTMEGIWKR